MSFSPEYGPKLKEEYVMVKHLPKILKDDDSRKCCLSDCFSCCNDNWQKVKNPAFGYASLISLFIYVLVTFIIFGLILHHYFPVFLCSGMGCTETWIFGIAGRSF